eukprot:m.6023 g.6023  ORF g.6023 m.6023 type:complete len:99 (+) comp2530_c0_seq1:54-350(+)
MSSREEKLAALRAAREGKVEGDAKAKNQQAMLKMKTKRNDEFKEKAKTAGMDLGGMDPTIAQFLSKGLSAEEMIAARSANRATHASTRTSAPPPPPGK